MEKIDKNLAYKEIFNHIKTEGHGFKGWYAGITEDIDRRLHQQHNVPYENHWFMYRKCFSSDDAREVEDALLHMGCSGGKGGGDNDAVYVYAYKKTRDTKE